MGTENEKTDLSKFDKNKCKEYNLSEEDLLFVKKIEGSYGSIELLSQICFYLTLALIYSISFLRNCISWIILTILGVFECHPNLFTFTLIFIFIICVLFRINLSKYSFLFGFIITFLINYVLHKIIILYIPDIIFKYIAIFFKKIFYLIHVLLSLNIANLISFIISVISAYLISVNKMGKIHTSKDQKYIMELLKRNECLFILFTPVNDPNYNFYKQKLSDLSIAKKGKFTFIMIHYYTEWDKHLYSYIFGIKNNDEPKFGFIKGKEKKIIMEHFPKKENFDKEISDFVDKCESEEINQNITKNNGFVKKEDEKEEKKYEDKEKEKEENKKNLEENVE